MNILIQLLISTLAVFVSGAITPGIQIKNFLTAMVVAIILAILNTFLKPVMIILTLPATILTFGLFIFVINTVIILTVSWIIKGFDVSSFWSALLFSLILSLVSSFLFKL